MSKLIINGPNVVTGEIAVQGAKNSVLPILAATLLANEVSVIKNCPDISDVSATVEILLHLGCKVTRRGSGEIEIDPSSASGVDIPYNLMRGMRSSVIMLGPILARMGRAKVSYPGGCELGPRPIDLHISSFQKLGVKFAEEYGFIYSVCDKMIGTEINLTFPSVGATENIMLLASKVPGQTVIHNAAREPEIEDLQSFLNSMGANITGAGDNTIYIEGVETLHGAEHSIIPDRIAAATYMIAAAITGGKLIIKSVRPRDLNSVISLLEESGAQIRTDENRILIDRKRPIQPIRMVRTMPYPGFPTDALAPLMAYSTVASGNSMYVETIFQNRYKHAEELMRMGANIKVEGRVALVQGVPRLTGANVVATDLRGGVALVLAALAANGETTIDNSELIDRGYENIETNLQSLGCKIRKVDVVEKS
ncbi:MAG: UDP-N-acetylglucosamine 1-carboxyvinyltransferase [Bacillota bacterium]|nr:UDP-N-acetylglucosamine 1-carboxyvinyltransferase [Bacillota bacterium]